MPFYVLGNVPAELPPRVRDRLALLRQLPVAGGPFATRAIAETFANEHIPAPTGTTR